MRILQLGKFYPIIGGVERVMYDITKGVSEQGECCDMLCATTDGTPPGTICLNDYGNIFCVSSMFKLAATMISPAMIFRLRKIRNDYDVIHIHHPDPMACVALFLSGYKGKVVLHWHADILKQKTLLKLYAPLQRWLLKRADVIVGTTPVYVKNSPFLGAVQNKVTAIPIGINRVAADKEMVRAIREQYKGKKIILSVGRLVEYKGYKYLIEAAGKLGGDYVVLIVGKGPLKDELQRLVREAGVEDKVKLLGFVPDHALSAYFEACDLFCLSSIWKTEAFAIVQIEAMSCGKPVVATRIKGSGVSWVNADGVSGLNVEPENAEELAAAIERILADKELYGLLAHGAAQRYLSLFSRKRMVDECMELYDSLLGKDALQDAMNI